MSGPTIGNQCRLGPETTTIAPPSFPSGMRAPQALARQRPPNARRLRCSYTYKGQPPVYILGTQPRNEGRSQAGACLAILRFLGAAFPGRQRAWRPTNERTSCVPAGRLEWRESVARRSLAKLSLLSPCCAPSPTLLLSSPPFPIFPFPSFSSIYLAPPPLFWRYR